MSNIHILPKHRFDAIIRTDRIKSQFDSIAFISICEPDSDLSCDVSVFDADSDNVLRVYVHDITQDLPYLFENGKRVEKTAKALTEEQARQIADFVTANLDKKTWLIHCTMGVARSGAVGAYVADRIGMPYEVLKQANPQIMPNSHIAAMLNRTKP